MRLGFQTEQEDGEAINNLQKPGRLHIPGLCGGQGRNSRVLITCKFEMLGLENSKE